MKELIEKLKRTYNDRIASIDSTGAAEINIRLNEGAARDFVQTLKDHLIELVDELTIVKINVFDDQGVLIDSFASNQ